MISYQTSEKNFFFYFQFWEIQSIMGKVQRQEFNRWSYFAYSQEAEMDADDHPNLWNGAMHS